MIARIEKRNLPDCLTVIQRSFRTVAEDFGFTRENCPGHTSFMTLERLGRDYDFGNPMFAYQADGRTVGFVALRPYEDERCEMKQLCVLPEYRREGIGRRLVGHAKRVASEELGKRRLTVGIIEEDAPLRAWYLCLGFVPAGVEKFPHLPFTVGFMEMTL